MQQGRQRVRCKSSLLIASCAGKVKLHQRRIVTLYVAVYGVMREQKTLAVAACKVVC